jgi:elongation factor Ts
MAAITASMVAELRGKTDAPMMECKKALTEADGDMAKAEELLRVKLGTKAGKAASRVTAEGVVTSSIDGTVGALLEVNCETDFVTKNDSFLAMAKAAAELIAKQNPADIAGAGALAYSQDGFGPTLEDVRKGLIGKIGENMSFRRFKRFATGAKLASYLHGSRIGVVCRVRRRRHRSQGCGHACRRHEAGRPVERRRASRSGGARAFGGCCQGC